ncbi:SMP-30/gluconolactonase/LRE family protein [Salipiger sp.]|uniref:SMP-30/gluconolactonase/LRE family protein n=1 Tax=Salipiger sp. TaxID=2078585 RepID=UPI003A982BDE
MTPCTPIPLGRTGATLGESPTWAPEENAVYWIDVIGRRVHRHDLGTGNARVYPVGGIPSAIALGRGGLVVVLRNGLALLDTVSGAETPLKLDFDFCNERFNDAAPDREGRLFVGSMDRRMTDPVGGLWRIDPDLGITQVARGTILGNGIAWSPDDRTLYFCDSRAGLVHAHAFDAATGEVRDGRVHLDLRPTGAHPDGCAMDADACLWVAEMPTGTIGRYDPGGHRIDEIRLPVPRVTSMAFCGPDLSQLCITTMRYGLSDDALAATPLAGCTFLAETGVRGLPVPLCALRA